jgi:hypothetical protein
MQCFYIVAAAGDQAEDIDLASADVDSAAVLGRDLMTEILGINEDNSNAM